MRCFVVSLTLLNQHMQVVHLIWQFTVTLYFLSEVVSVITWYISVMATTQHVDFRFFWFRLNSLLAPCWLQGLQLID